jgi:hypothetical protein
MADIKNIEYVQLALVFFVPGLIIVYTRSRFITSRLPSQKDNVLGYLALSSIYYALTIPVAVQSFSIREPWRAIAWLVLALVGPWIFGLILGVAAQKQWGTWIANKFNLNVVHVIPAAWDWRFSTIPRGGLFVMVTLSNDEKVAGFFGQNSFASSDGSERDVYIEEEYTLRENVWEARPDKVGILIPLSVIQVHRILGTEQ